MTPEQFAEIQKRLALGKEALAQLLGVTSRAIERYTDGTRAIPEPTARLMRVILALGLDPAQVFALLRKSFNASRVDPVSSPSPRASSRARPRASRRASKPSNALSAAASPSVNPPVGKLYVIELFDDSTPPNSDAYPEFFSSREDAEKALAALAADDYGGLTWVRGGKVYETDDE